MGREGRDARELLEKRGLTAEVVNEARAILALANTLETAVEAGVEDATAFDREAEDRLWNWYLEWSQIARTVITDRRRLRALGFLRGTESGDEIETPDVEASTPLNGTPTPTA